MAMDTTVRVRSIAMDSSNFQDKVRMDMGMDMVRMDKVHIRKVHMDKACMSSRIITVSHIMDRSRTRTIRTRPWDIRVKLLRCLIGEPG